MPEKLKVEHLHDGQVVRITLNAPKANVLDSSMMSELQNVLDGLKEQPHVKMIQFMGKGENFSFGASVEEHTKENAPKMLEQFHKLFFTLAELSIPTAALVSGQCLGGGCELALMCNFIFVDQSAKLGQPEIMLGVFPPPASLILPMKIGQAKADELLLTGKSVSAEVAVECGLVKQMFASKEEMITAVDVWVGKTILPKSASSLRIANKVGRKSFNATLCNELKTLEKIYIDKLMETHDANEGINSFLEKRQAEWKDE